MTNKEATEYVQKAEDQSPPEFEGESYYSMFLLCLSSVFAQTIERITTPDRDGCVWIKAKKVNK